MGYMSEEFDFSKGYCKNGDTPDFVLLNLKLAKKFHYMVI